MFAGMAEKRNACCLPIPHPRGSALLRREVGEARGIAIEVKQRSTHGPSALNFCDRPYILCDCLSEGFSFLIPPILAQRKQNNSTSLIPTTATLQATAGTYYSFWKWLPRRRTRS